MKRTALTLALIWSLPILVPAEDDGPVESIADVMKRAHKGRDSLLKRVLKENATQEEQQLLKRYYQFLATQTPPNGSAEGWAGQVGELQSSLDAVIAGEDDGTRKLRSATNCMACHRLYRYD